MEVRGALDRLAGSACFREPRHLVQMRGQQLDELQLRLTAAAELAVTVRRHQLEALAGRLHILDPRRQLERGYAILTDREGRPVGSVQGQRRGAELSARLVDGTLELTVR